MKTAVLPLMCGMSALLTVSADAAVIYDHEGTSLDIFGRVQAAWVNDETWQDLSGEPAAAGMGLYGSMRLGIAARSAIAPGFDGIMMGEWETSLHRNDNGSHESALNRTRYLYAGFDAYQYGTLIFGRGDSAYYTVAGATDIFNVMAGDADDYYILGDQRPSSVMYALSGLSWDLRLSYQLATDSLGDTPIRPHRGYAAAVSTRFGDNITFAYGLEYLNICYHGSDSQAAATADFFVPQLMADGLSADAAYNKSRAQYVGRRIEYGAALSYGHMGSGLYAALTVGSTNYEYLNHHIYHVDTAINYTWNNGFSLGLGYGFKSYDGTALISDLTVGASWNFNAAFKVFAEGRFDLDGDAASFYGPYWARELGYNENRAAVGAEFNF